MVRCGPRALALVLTAAALAGCSLPHPYRPELPRASVPPHVPSPAPPIGEAPSVPPVAEPAPAPAPTAPAPVTRRYQLGAATQSLVELSRAQAGRGDLDAASTTLDRALRIEPRNPLLWLELGRVRLAQDEARQAESYARRALSLATGDRRVQADARRLLAATLRAQKRNIEAGAAERAAGP